MIDALLHAHLSRLLVAGGLSVLGGLLLGFRTPTRSFGRMTAIWGAIDLAIALVSLNGSSKAANVVVPFVALNEGLNVGYVGVGVAMALLARERRTIRDFGLAVVVQGAILIALDGKLWWDIASLTSQAGNGR